MKAEILEPNKTEITFRQLAIGEAFFFTQGSHNCICIKTTPTNYLHTDGYKEILQAGAALDDIGVTVLKIEKITARKA